MTEQRINTSVQIKSDIMQLVKIAAINEKMSYSKFIEMAVKHELARQMDLFPEESKAG